MKKVTLTIDNKRVESTSDTTILDAAKSVGIEIPSLCHMKMESMGVEHCPGECRICVVEVEGARHLMPACVTKCGDNMVVNSHSIRVVNARRNVMDLILSDHPADCLVCAKSGECDLQSMAHSMGIREIRFKGEQSNFKREISQSIRRDMDKCILCRRCSFICNEIQTVGVLAPINRGFESVVSTAFNMNIDESACTFCGQCLAVCPTGALSEYNNTPAVVRLLADKSKTVVVQTAPAVRAALGEEFGLEPGTVVTGKMVAALRQLGFDKVCDTNFAADLTIMEEGTELLNRLNRHLSGDTTVKLPMLTSCCPAWVKFVEHQFPELMDIPSTARSPQQMFGSIAKTYMAEKMGIKNREDIIVVSIMPCVAKKYECNREEFSTNGNPDVDFALTTRELAQLIKMANIDFNQLEDEKFDSLMGESTGAGVIFGTTGGVIEAAMRTAYELHTGKRLEKIEFENLRGMEGIREAKVDLDGTTINIGIAHGLGNARKLLEDVRDGKSKFHAIEIMSCPGGCIGGGGQPYHHGNTSILLERQKAIYSEDRNKEIRMSHHNPEIQRLYSEFLGEPMSSKAHKLLHTQYFDRSNVWSIETKDKEMK